jgi:uncharacterized cupredoxin-like copper-binding protein
MTPRSRLWRAEVLAFAIVSAGWQSAVVGAHHMRPAKQIRIVATEFKLTKAARAGRSDANDDDHEHIAKTHADPGKTGTATVMPKPGVYRFMCHVRGHRKAGMYGKLVVVES